MKLATRFRRETDASKPADRRTWTLTHQPQTFQQWKNWIDELGKIVEPGVGLVFSDEPVLEGHGVPIRWGYELYCLGCGRRADGTFDPMTDEELRDLQTEYVIKASRAGGKTLMIALVGFSLCRWNDGYQWNHTAAVKEQADRVWGYLRDRLIRDQILAKEVVKDTREVISFANGSNANILTGSGEGQNSKHPQFQSFDEVEYMDIEVIREGRLAAIRKRRPDGVNLPSIGVFISTQKKANQTMFTLIQEAKAGKKRLIVSNVFDVIERCEEWRTRSLPVGLACSDWEDIVHELAYLALNRASLDMGMRRRLQELEQRKELLISNCRMVGDCRGCAKRACGWYSIDDAIKKSDDKPFWRAQMLSKQPQMEHAVYSQFSEEENVTIEAEYRRDLAVLAFMDYGFMQDPTYICLAQSVGTYVCVFAEQLIENISSDLLPGELRKFLSSMMIGAGDVSEVAPDPSAGELHKHLRNDGFEVVIRRGRSARNIAYGVEKVAELVFNAGHRKLLIHPRCQMLIQNMLVYEKDASQTEYHLYTRLPIHPAYPHRYHHAITH